MKLYVTDLSPNSRRVLAVMHQLGLAGETEVQKFNLVEGQHRSEDFREINPNMKVPVLVDGDFKLWEANPIMIYMSDRQGAEEFCPSDSATRIEILRWISWEVQHFNRAIGDITWETVAKQFFNMGEPDAEKIKSGQENFRRFAAVLEEHLADRDFILGDKPTVADFAVGSHSALALYPQSQVPLLEFPKVLAWFQRLETLPAWAKTAPQAPAEAAE
ncbi:glutathione S-transferase [Labrenzia sp. EL_208]|uniref:glutathione S-transferase family protein n=1 Tax=Roseibium album TaxID=311410 RepID=UPI000D55C369|nr:glutathione S-transferase family protein [Roseibium album]MBG6173131.1 glutathione S-transferase [Labrenzia sp. EL_132]MBG6203173.1 glutathione S-transferase [Labrenzia sp. EL_13]MBG6228099.1 glutathione S-transferase [Labrenzia sp. EL_208]MCR9059741.1 glutathione S-transferase family protein [Paracoccaceae bacterium]